MYIQYSRGKRGKEEEEEERKEEREREGEGEREGERVFCAKRVFAVERWLGTWKGNVQPVLYSLVSIGWMPEIDAGSTYFVT